MRTDGSIAPGGRFERIEVALGRIEDKIDHKANASGVLRLEQRISELEHGASPLGGLMRDFDDLKVRLARLEREGSQSAQDAGKLARELQAKVVLLETEHERRAAVLEDAAERDARSYQRWMLSLGCVSAVNALFSVLQIASLVR